MEWRAGNPELITHQAPLDPASVERATENAREMSYGELLETILSAADMVGPFNPDQKTNISSFLAQACERIEIAKVICNKFADHLVDDIKRNSQEVLERGAWKMSVSFDGLVDLEEPSFVYEDVYADGQLTWAALWSTDPRYTEELVEYGAIKRGLRVTVPDNAHIYEIHEFEDWFYLIDSNPGNSTSKGISPSWASIAEKYDAVHLSWAGFILAHDNYDKASEQGIIPLSYWDHEGTMWLRPMFSPTKLASPLKTC